MKINLPISVKEIITKLTNAGYEAYAVGGCIRDSVRMEQPDDWDICTSALPQEVEKVFSGFHIIETGLQHGTVTIMIDHVGYEITTYRTEGSYSDRRKPDFVKFVSELREDVNRRDFTINAMAYNDTSGLQDYFGGKEDLKNGIIRCVGDANERFNEDALRILRAMRFAARFDFEIAPATAEAMHKNKSLLSYVSKERISAELLKLLKGDGAARILREFFDVLSEVIPEILPCVGFEQHNKFHCYDVWEHMLAAVDAAKNESILRLTMLLHDIAKPQCFTIKDEMGHFYGHEESSAKMAGKIIKRLKMSNDIYFTVTTLIRYHGSLRDISEKGVKRLINKIGLQNVRLLLDVSYADIMAHAAYVIPQRLEQLKHIAAMVDKIEINNECCKISDLKIGGNDLIAYGIKPGPDIGRILNTLLDMVIDGKIKNEHSILLKYIQKNN